MAEHGLQQKLNPQSKSMSNHNQYLLFTCREFKACQWIMPGVAVHEGVGPMGGRMDSANLLCHPAAGASQGNCRRQ